MERREKNNIKNYEMPNSMPLNLVFIFIDCNRSIHCIELYVNGFVCKRYEPKIKTYWPDLSALRFIRCVRSSVFFWSYSSLSQGLRSNVYLIYSFEINRSVTSNNKMKLKGKIYKVAKNDLVDCINKS